MKHITLALAALSFVTVSAQNVQRESIQVDYISRPSEPLPAGVSTYNVVVNQSYRDQYEAELTQWEIDTQLAQETYNAEMEAYNAKGTGAKILERALLDEKKPQLILPRKPVATERVFERGIIGSKVDMQGMTRTEDGATVTIEIQYFEGSAPEEGKKEIKDKEGNVTFKYYRTMKYRQPIRYMVQLPDGSIVVDEVLTSSEDFTTYTSDKYTSKSALNKAWNLTAVNNRLSQMSVQAGCIAINSNLNDRFCFSKKTRPMTIYHAKTKKKVDYTDLNNAALDMKMAMEKYLNQPEASAEGIRACVAVWEQVLTEADFDNKKARINRKMAGLLYLNLINANIWLEDYDRVDVLFDEMRRLDTKKSAEGTADGLDTFSEDQRRRKEINS
ncbi:MAG: hypothetical protein CL828_05255 [Crocinitomicaceae bacterium]|nr:hypothetical protein [Crocinitomicaceae bacterium]